MSTSTKYVGSTTPEQKAELLEFLKSHPGLTSGKFTNDFTFKKARGLWESLANTLNAMPGARKDWKKWRKVTRDYDYSLSLGRLPLTSSLKSSGYAVPFIYIYILYAMFFSDMA